jgi:hypothetical protein
VEAAILTRETLVYLYGFVSPGADLQGLAGVEPGAGVFLIAAGDVACAASLVPAADYARARSAAEQGEWASPRAWRHHEVVRALHASCSVVPLKFGTLCNSPGDVEAVLHRLEPSIADLLRHFDRADEWTVRISADPGALSAYVQSAYPELIACAAEVERLTGGAAYFARKRLQSVRVRAVAEAVENVGELLAERLADLGVECTPVRRDARGVESHTIAETAVLIQRPRFGELEALLAVLEAEHAALHLSVEFVGPWPPYSFAPALNASEAQVH